MEAMGTRTSRMRDALQPSVNLSNLVQLLNFSTLINSKLCQHPSLRGPCHLRHGPPGGRGSRVWRQERRRLLLHSFAFKKN